MINADVHPPSAVTTEGLIPCPFCSGGITQVRENTYWTGMRSEITSVEVMHWCEEPQNGVRGSSVTMRAKTEAEAKDKWNTRMGLDYFHLGSGGKDPEEKRYSKRDVEFLVSVCLAMEKAKKEGA